MFTTFLSFSSPTFPRWPDHATFLQSSTPAIFRMMFLKGIILSSVSDPDPVGSVSFGQIQIRIRKR